MPAAGPAPPARSLWPVYAVLLLVFLIWSNSFLAVRALVGEDVPAGERLAPVELVEARFVPVALWCLLWFALVPEARRAARRLLAEHPVLTPSLGLLNVWGYNLAFAAGHQRVAAGTGSLITALNPILTFFLTALLGQEKLSWRKAASLAVAFGGLYVVVVHGAGRQVEAAYLTDALVLTLAPCSWALYTVLGKPLLARHPPLHTTFLTLGLASLPTLPLAAFDRRFQNHLAAWGPGRWGSALFLSLACTVLAFWLWFEAVKRLPASTAAAFVFLNAPLTVGFEWLWFRRVPQPAFIAGGLLVLTGVWLCVRDGRPRAAAAVAR